MIINDSVCTQQRVRDPSLKVLAAVVGTVALSFTSKNLILPFENHNLPMRISSSLTPGTWGDL